MDQGPKMYRQRLETEEESRPPDPCAGLLTTPVRKLTRRYTTSAHCKQRSPAVKNHHHVSSTVSKLRQ